MSTSEALAAWKLFLETTPPNTSVKFQGLAEASLHARWCFDTPHIQLHCEIDRGPRRFDPTSKTIGLVRNFCNYTFGAKCRPRQKSRRVTPRLLSRVVQRPPPGTRPLAVGSTGRRRSRPLRSRIKPGSTTPPSSRRRGVDLAGNDGTSSSTSGGSGWVSCARRSSWGWQIWRGMWSDGGHRGAMSNRRRGRFSVPDPRVGCT